MTRRILSLTAVLAGILCARVSAQDAGALEAQYKTCAKHYIPADKCTPEIYQQLKSKEDAPLDPKVSLALNVLKQYQVSMRNPDSMNVRLAYVTEPNDAGQSSVCLTISGQNGMGGMSSASVQWIPAGFYNKRRKKDDLVVYDDESSLFCSNGKAFHPTRLPGTDITEKVNDALKARK